MHYMRPLFDMTQDESNARGFIDGPDIIGYEVGHYDPTGEWRQVLELRAPKGDRAKIGLHECTAIAITCRLNGGADVHSEIQELANALADIAATFSDWHDHNGN